MSDTADQGSPPDPADALRLVRAFMKMSPEARAELLRRVEGEVGTDGLDDGPRLDETSSDEAS